MRAWRVVSGGRRLVHTQERRMASEGRDSAHVQFFAADRTLQARRMASKWEAPLVVVLEGVPGSNKGKLLERLGKIGYTVGHEPFLPLLQRCGSVEKASEAAMERFAAFVELTRTGEHKHRDGIAFYARSGALSSLLCSKPTNSPPVREADVRNAARLTTRVCGGSARCAIVECLADELVVRQKLGERHFYASPEERALRESLFEQDDDALEAMALRYAQARETGHIDAMVHTTSVKQAMPGLLELFGIVPSMFKEDYEGVPKVGA